MPKKKSCSWMNTDVVWIKKNEGLGTKKHRTTKARMYERTPFLADHGAIIHSSRFRRLSNKTQVHLNPQVDYVRTRLTHSIEVSQIGRQFARILANTLSENNNMKTYAAENHRSFERDFEDLVATACLAHDIGQAPFGHKGEEMLHTLSTSFGSSFDANKQNFRLLVGSQIGALSPLYVTSALADAVMKYKSDKLFADKPQKSGGSFKSEQKAKALILEKTSHW